MAMNVRAWKKKKNKEAWFRWVASYMLSSTSFQDRATRSTSQSPVM